VQGSGWGLCGYDVGLLDYFVIIGCMDEFFCDFVGARVGCIVVLWVRGGFFCSLLCPVSTGYLDLKFRIINLQF
jgi:hypothetical protein